MAYVVNKTDGTILARLADGVVNTSVSDLTLIGRNFAGFGEYLNENLVKLLENFASTGEPKKPLIGQLWYDKASKTIKVYSGTSFKPVANISVVTTEPTDLATGDFWFDSNNEQLYVYNGTAFKLIGPALGAGTSSSGFQVSVIEDTLSLNHTVVKMLVDGTTVAIISKDEFDPKTTIPGFADGIFKGYTLNQSLLNNQFFGRALQAQSLYSPDTNPNILEPTKFMRTDIDTATAGNLTVSGNVISMGSDVLNISINTSSDVTIRNIEPDAKISFEVTYDGALNNAITIDGQTKNIGIWNSTPATDLDIVGNVAVDGTIQADSITVTNAITAGDSSTKVATTAFVQGEKVSPSFSGTPTAPTAAPGTNTTQIATTAFVQASASAYLPLAGGTMTGAMLVQRASAVTPSIAFGVDQDTGIFSTGANTLNISTGGVNRFTFDNTGSLTVTGTVIELSDSAVKEDIQPIKNALNKVLQLNGVKYRSKLSGKRRLGLVAQNVQTVEKDLVEKTQYGMLGVMYGDSTALLVEALKEQQAQIEELKQRLEAITKFDK
jgi:hypothetical protein